MAPTSEATASPRRASSTVTTSRNKQLAWVQFFSWFALFATWIYTTAAVTGHISGTTDTNSALYNEGANGAGVAFAAYNGVAAVVAFGIPVLAKKTSRRIAHAIGLICGADFCGWRIGTMWRRRVRLDAVDGSHIIDGDGDGDGDGEDKDEDEDGDGDKGGVIR